MVRSLAYRSFQLRFRREGGGGGRPHGLVARRDYGEERREEGGRRAKNGGGGRGRDRLVQGAAARPPSWPFPPRMISNVGDLIHLSAGVHFICAQID